MANQTRILFVHPYPGGMAPSQRFRFEQYYNILEENGFQVRTAAFYSIAAWRILYLPGHFISKFFHVLAGYIKRFMLIFRIPVYDFVFIHREITPAGPPVIEWIISRVLRKKIIYDFDDAIWLPDKREESAMRGKIKNRSKFKTICKLSHRISAGNQFLADFASNYNPNVIYNPTTIDTENRHNRIKEHREGKTIIGWTGSHSTMGYLNQIYPVLKELTSDSNIELLVISNQKPDLDGPFTFMKWDRETEIDDLLRIDIGVMPLPDDQWSQGKCGLKILQYMSLGIPPVASPVGVNKMLITNEVDGFLCSDNEEWRQQLTRLINDHLLRAETGKSGISRVRESFSVSSNSRNFLSLFAPPN